MIFPPLPKSSKKPSLNEIDSFFQNSIQAELVSLESERQALLRLFGIYTVIGISLTLVIVYFFGFKLSGNSAFSSKSIEPIFGVGSLVNGGLFLLWRKSYKKYAQVFKLNVMNKVTSKFFPGLKYSSERFISKEDFLDSKLHESDIDHYNGNDYFEGSHQNVSFRFSELLVQDDRGSGKNRRRVTVFHGFFFISEFPKDIYFRTTIQPDQAEGVFGILGRGLQRIAHGKRLVDLENPEFEKKFVVTSDDQVEARYILTPFLMEKICTFQEKWAVPISLCFVNRRLYLSIATGKDYFEPRVWGDIFTRSDIMSLIEAVNLLVNLVEDINKNSHFAAKA